MEEIGGDKCKFIKQLFSTVRNTEKLPKRLFPNPQVLGCRFLEVLVLVRDNLLHKILAYKIT